MARSAGGVAQGVGTAAASRRLRRLLGASIPSRPPPHIMSWNATHSPAVPSAQATPSAMVSMPLPSPRQEEERGHKRIWRLNWAPMAPARHDARYGWLLSQISPRSSSRAARSLYVMCTCVGAFTEDPLCLPRCVLLRLSNKPMALHKWFVKIVSGV
ncbi:hypothetical protein ACQJBY_069756 [Aegilops geniculata]